MADPTQPIKVLLTEDHLDTAKVLRILLERNGFVVRTAGNVAEALQAAQEEHFDLCICDMRLPDGEGTQLAAQLRELHRLKSICLSGDSNLADLRMEPDSPFAEYLTKPIDIAIMLEAVQKLTSR
jgi:two-component system, NtrC family, response regulator PilR